jgi:hypothetical protein
MFLPIIGKFTWGAFGLGAVSTVVGAALLRPLIVGTVRAGYEATDLARDAWTKAKLEADSIRTEALTTQTLRNTEVELQQLREEVAALRAQSTGKRTPATA